MAAVSKSTGTAIRYLRSIDLPDGAAEIYQLAEGPGRFVYLPLGTSPLLSFATARRFVRPSGERMSALEVRVATELWRLGLDDVRRHALHELGARVRQERSELGLSEWIYLPWEQPTDDLAKILEIMRPETPPNPEILLERVLADWARHEPELETEEASLATSALIAGREALPRLLRNVDVDALVLIGPVGRRVALEAATRWLSKARAAPGTSKSGPAEDSVGMTPDPDARRFRVRFPIPENAGRSVNAEMATRWLGQRLTALEAGAAVTPPRLRVTELRLERSEASPRLELLIELSPTTSSSSAASLLGSRLSAARSGRVERSTRRLLAEGAESTRQRRIEGPFPLVFTLLEATLEDGLEDLARPVAAPRPGAITTWLDAVLRMEHASWSVGPP